MAAIILTNLLNRQAYLSSILEPKVTAIVEDSQVQEDSLAVPENNLAPSVHVIPPAKVRKSTTGPALEIIPKYEAGVDYAYLYHKMFQANERALQQYDSLLAQREADLSLYMNMK